MAVSIPAMSATQVHNHMIDGQSGLPSASGGSKRPKLSLQTTSLSGTYGSLTRGLGPNTAQSTYTPTTTNTLSNTWDLTIRPSPILRTESPRPKTQAPQQPYFLSLPFGIKSILKNSPLPPRQGSVSASPRESRRKVFFPQPKKVLFRSDLEETIETSRYVSRHYDLSSSEDEADEPRLSPTSTSAGSTPGLHSPPPSRKRKHRRDSGICVDIPEEKPPFEDAGRSMKAKSRGCKRRRWQWTLGSDEPAVQEVVSPASANEDDELEAEDCDNEVDPTQCVSSPPIEKCMRDGQGQDLGTCQSIEGSSTLSVSDAEPPAIPE